MATSVADNNGVYLVPAFSGLGAPLGHEQKGVNIRLNFQRE